MQLCLAQLHMGFYQNAKISEKPMIQFQENVWTDGGMDCQKDKGLCFIGFFQALHGYKNYLSFSTLYIYFSENISKKWLYLLS